jgi:hypothetical protein
MLLISFFGAQKFRLEKNWQKDDDARRNRKKIY